MVPTMQTNETQALEITNWGVDLRPEDRPGVPRESAPHLLAGTHWLVPSQQPVTMPMLVRAELDQPTLVFSTALQCKATTEFLRRKAYGIPDHLVRHWLLLLVASRMDMLTSLPNWIANRNAITAKPAPKPNVLQAAA